MPEYIVPMLAVDMVRQAPGDETWSITHDDVRNEVARWAGGITVIWFIDSTTGRQLTTPTANGRSAGFDADVDWFCWFAGTYLFIDGGQLDVGVLRDSVLSSTNQAGTFYESFEALARVGPYQGAHVVSSLCADGVSQAPQNIAVCSPQGS